MAVAQKPSRKIPKNKQIIESIIQAVQDLYDAHAGEIAEFRDQSEDSKVTVNFGIEIDCSESEPKVKVGIRFSKSVTDSRIATLDDPEQVTLFSPEQFAKRQEKEKAAEGGDGQ